MHVQFASNAVVLQAFLQSDFFGKCIFLALFVLSIATWYVLIQKMFAINQAKKQASLLRQNILNQNESLLSLSFSIASPKEDPFLKIFESTKQKTIEILDKNHYFHPSRTQNQQAVFLSHADMDHIDAHVQGVIGHETKKLGNYLFVLSTIVSLAPFLGILGTVWGILLSLGEMQKGAAAHSNSIILGGISTALATTVLGLVIAIPALIAYNYLKNSLQNFYSDMCDFSSYLLSTIELQYRKVDAT